MTDDNETTDSPPVCGGENGDGSTCKRRAGWGTPNDEGPCTDHLDDYHNPDKLTEATKNTLIGAAEAGAFKEHCAQAAGITSRTLRNWLEWGEEDAESGISSPCADLFFRFQRARGAGAVNRLNEAKDEFVLERSYGYTKTEKREHEHAGPDGAPLNVTIRREAYTGDDADAAADGDGEGENE